MSTRSAIGLVEPNGVRAIYVHNDGYLEGVGETLKDNYTDIFTINKLLDLGDLSILGEVPVSDPKLWNVDIDPDYFYNSNKCRAYKDRGEVVPSVTFRNEDEFIDSYALDVSYLYLFKDGIWYYMNMGEQEEGFKPLEDAFYESLAEKLDKTFFDKQQKLTSVEDKAVETQDPAYANAVREMEKTEKIKEETVKMEETPEHDENPKRPKMVPEAKKMFLDEEFKDEDEEEVEEKETFELTEGLEEPTFDFILKIFEDTDYDIQEDPNHAEFEEISHMSEEDLKEWGLIGASALTIDEDGKYFVVNTFYEEKEKDYVSEKVNEVVKDLNDEELMEVCSKENLEEALYNDQIDEFFKRCKRLGITDLKDVQRLQNELDAKDPLDAVRKQCDLLEKDGIKELKEAKKKDLHVVIISTDIIDDLKEDLKRQNIKIDSIWVNTYDGFFFVNGYPSGYEVDDSDGYLTDEYGLDEDELYTDDGSINKEYIIDECGLQEWDGVVHYWWK